LCLLGSSRWVARSRSWSGSSSKGDATTAGAHAPAGRAKRADVAKAQVSRNGRVTDAGPLLQLRHFFDFLRVFFFFKSYNGVARKSALAKQGGGTNGS